MNYRLLTRWSKSKSSWSYVPEHNGITLSRAREIVRRQKHWQPCGLQQRITTKSGRVVSTYRSKIVSRKRRDEIYRIYLPELSIG